MKKLIIITAAMLWVAVFNNAVAQPNPSSFVKTRTASGKNAKSPLGSNTGQELRKITQELLDAMPRGDKNVLEHYLGQIMLKRMETGE